MILKNLATTVLFSPLLLTNFGKAEMINPVRVIHETSYCHNLSYKCNLPKSTYKNLSKELSADDIKTIIGLMTASIKEAQAGKYQQALDGLQRAVQIAKAGDHPNLEWSAREQMGYVYYLMDDIQKRREIYEENLAFARENRERLKNDEESFSLEHLSWVYNAQGNYQKAIELLNQAIALSKNGLPLHKAYRLNAIGVNLFQAGNIAESEKALFSSIEHYEIGIKDSISKGLFNPDMYEDEVEVMRQLQKVLVDLNKIEKALELAERGRTRAFVGLLARRLENNSGFQADIPSPNIEQIKQIAKAQNSTIVTYSVIYEFRPYKIINFDDLAKLPAKNLLIWVVKPTGEIAFKQINLNEKNALIGELVQLTRESIGARGRGLAITARTEANSRLGFNQRLQELHQLLIEPIADKLPTDPSSRVTFIPQDSLFLVPFAALQDRAGKYLIEKHTIINAPSFQVLDLTRQQQKAIRDTIKSVLIVGNPTMPSLTEEGSPPQQLSSLPGAEREANAIAKIFNAQAITGNAATKTAIAQRISQARIIHLATHGLLDDAGGFFSSLALAPSSRDNGFLTAREIIALKLNAELVVLSACDTGKGKITGDGVVGLSRSFIGAGTPSVIVSLWAVPDGPTAELMTAFYQNLKNGSDKVQALRSAMLQTMKQFPNPRDWGAFTLIGEADTSKTLQAVTGDPAITDISYNSGNTMQATASRYTVFPVPPNAQNYRESPSKIVEGEIDILFETNLSFDELVAFYRQAFTEKGLTENTALTSRTEQFFQIVFDGSPNGRKIVIQGTDLRAQGFAPTVSVSFH
ncbi:MAG TPA: CHAT domain-containing tetratricopeptide repeat protein [Leptolyngbyaceae cyanobacterium]